MLERVLTAYHRFAKSTGRSAPSRRPVSLQVAALEERATPAASYVPLVAPPQTVLVAPIAAPASVVGHGSLAIPMPGQSIVRLDLIAPGDTSQAEEPQESVLATQHWQEADVAPVVQANVDLEEELAELLAANADA